MKIEDIKINSNRRVVDQAKVKELIASITELGLINPITVNSDGTLIAGMHRLTAFKEMGKLEIPVNIISVDSLKAELAEIDENLCRNEIHFTERGDLLSRKKAIYEELYPQVQHGGDRKSKRHNAVLNDSFTEKTSEELGVSRTSIERELKISNTLTPETKKVVRDNNIGKVDALKIARDVSKAVKASPSAEDIEAIKRQAEQEALQRIEQERQQKKEAKKLLLEKKKQEVMQVESAEVVNKPTVYKKDCLEYLDTVDNNSIDLLITDPPYSTDVDDIAGFAKSWVHKALSKVKESGRAFICIGAYPSELLAYLSELSKQDKFIVDNPLIWTYRNTLGVTPKMKYNLNYQVILHLYSEESSQLDTSITGEMFSVQDINAPDGRLANRFHAWQKPNELARRLITHASKEGDKIIDCFCCTGTFLVMASKLNRLAEGCDVSVENLEIAKNRGCNVVY